MAEYRIGALAPVEPFTPEEGKEHLDSVYRTIPWYTIVDDPEKAPLTTTLISQERTDFRTAA